MILPNYARVCVFVSPCLSVCLSVSLSLSICLYFCLSLSVSLSLFVSHYICLSACVYVCDSPSLSVCVCVCLPLQNNICYLLSFFKPQSFFSSYLVSNLFQCSRKQKSMLLVTAELCRNYRATTPIEGNFSTAAACMHADSAYNAMLSGLKLRWSASWQVIVPVHLYLK